MERYRVVNEDSVELLTGEFAGILYQYGGVRLEPDHVMDRLTIAFTHTILSGPTPSNVAAFHQCIGDILVELIHKGIGAGNLIFRSDKQEDSDATRDKNSGMPNFV